MTSRIEKAQQLVEGKSRYKTPKYLEEEKKEYYLDLIRKFPITLPAFLKMATFHNNMFEFYVDRDARLKCSINITFSTYSYSIFFVQESYNKSEMTFELNRQNISKIEDNLAQLIDLVIIEEMERRKSISKTSDIYRPQHPSSYNYWKYKKDEGTGTWVKVTEDVS